MSRPKKIIPPVKGEFQDIINAVSDGGGVKKIKGKPRPKNIGVKSTKREP